ncbi:MAG: hypothetical protein A2836_00215 [Candidatus Taylorbacteria bacterium RIFCSPHIGHO2_01_FULL_45_63]|uniref:Glycosyltransferase subfamily 4-like N-terminal domain-containing protein n=1 Tax=Candidatus Taylorbacteria bacterium RIFCSPHIGHO2_02_FULL_45_35 TaxID=1802311 RepID=A0A1G2MXW1_9BACT|nr:MAG: hypothetical protein A2836_00215 [Candidatus Taylorbacteria bacterium RIFCSPHIGHO2_01_FULL_45_63]OHA27852.1 MAG: hypothetical protein A3D56_01385 [Candidatus Taylorbacteria bacterium RIFCSPHIGHO2_02_FULL_45_35]OHA32414.1 MAG: hypothetical protein A3A22_00950 [Candidatus Taylorbacteria bacterium RIFCSPLOWO2_01_FULL_45_34b]
MKILFVSDMNIEFVCGSTYFCKRLATLLQKRGHEVAFMCPSGKSQYKSCARYTFDGFTVFGVRSIPSLVQKTLRVTLPLGIKKGLTETLENYKPDIIHVQSHGPLPWTVIKIAKRMRIPVVGTNHFVPDNVVHVFGLPKPILALFIWLEWKHLHFVFKRLDHITTPTDTAARLLRESGFEKTVRVVSNGVDLTTFNKNNRGEHLKERYHLPQKPILLFVGRLDPEKKLEVLLNALPIALRDVDMHTVIVGRGNRGSQLKAMAESLGIADHVTFTGFLADEDLPSMYMIADCFVMPGNAELQSIATMEAMASGLPIIAARAMALPELVHDGENGYLFSEGDHQNLAEKIVALLKDRKLGAEMSKKSLEIVSEHDIGKTVEKFESLYREA